MPWPALAAASEGPPLPGSPQGPRRGPLNAAADKFGRAAARGPGCRRGPLLEGLRPEEGGPSGERWRPCGSSPPPIPRASGRTTPGPWRSRSAGPGQSPDRAEADDEPQLYALNGLMASGSKQALPLMLKFLEGPHSARLKGQALFVLTQSDSPEARKILLEVARGTRHPESSRSRPSNPSEPLASGGPGAGRDLRLEAPPAVKLMVLDGYMAAGAEEQNHRRRPRREGTRRYAAKPSTCSAPSDPHRSPPALPRRRLAGHQEADPRPPRRGRRRRGPSGIARDEKGPPCAAKPSRASASATRPRPPRRSTPSTPAARRPIPPRRHRGLFIQNNAKALIELYRGEKDQRPRARSSSSSASWTPTRRWSSWEAVRRLNDPIYRNPR